MNNKNPKIIKLKREQKALKSWRDKGEWCLIGNAFISSIPFAFATSISMGLGFSIFAFMYLFSSIASICVHMLYGKEKMLERIKENDQEILELVKTDSEQIEVLKEYDKIEKLDMEIKQKKEEKENQKRIVEKMIEKYNLKMQLEETKKRNKDKVKNFKKQISSVENEIKEIKEEDSLQQ